MSYLSSSMDLVSCSSQLHGETFFHVWHLSGNDDVVFCPRTCTVFLVTSFFGA